jgi:hydroxyacylglutathione hydrolase
MLTISAIPAFKDNYIWAIHDATQCWVVDPGDSAPVIAFLQDHQLSLTGILITHWHPDHTGGIEALTNSGLISNGFSVIGPKSEHIPQVTKAVTENEQLTLLGNTCRVIEVPGHTLDHIAYFIELADHNGPALFCGDTVFVAGCGRMFEGDAETMHGSISKLAALPDNTRLYCAHEYTEANIRFARAVEPDNQQIAEREAEILLIRSENQPTVPGLLSQEKMTNPFLRCNQDAVIAAALSHDGSIDGSQPYQVFAAIRKWKDSF